MNGCAFRFLLRDQDTNLYRDAGSVYAREKISHALRSRPNNARRRKWLRQRRQKTNKKRALTEDQERTVQRLIAEQQLLLQQLIHRETAPRQAVKFAPFT